MGDKDAKRDGRGISLFTEIPKERQDKRAIIPKKNEIKLLEAVETPLFHIISARAW